MTDQPRMMRVVALLLLALLGTPVAGSLRGEADLDVKGYGLFGNLALGRLASNVLPDEEVESFDAVEVEDAFFMIRGRVEQDGHLRPSFTLVLTAPDGRVRELAVAPGEFPEVPRDFPVENATVIVAPGVQYYYKSLRFEGLAAMPAAEAEAFFFTDSALFAFTSQRVFSPEALNGAVGKLATELRQRGYQSAQVTVAEEQRDDSTGAVDVVVAVEEGPRFWVRTLAAVWADGASPTNVVVLFDRQPTDQVYNEFWLQEQRRQLRNRFYEAGFRDVDISTHIVAREEIGQEVRLDLELRVTPGPPVTVADVVLEGNDHTRASVIRRRLELRAGDALNPLALEQARFRLARLGVFDRIEFRVEPPDEGRQRDVVFSFEERPRTKLNLYLGWGSYEMLRGGFRLERQNIWGRAHHAQLRVMQSMRSSRADLSYRLPELFGEDIGVSWRIDYMRREEPSFTREEYGTSLGLDFYVRPIRSSMDILYTLERVRASDPEVAELRGLREATIGRVNVSLNHDQRDNPIYPEEGYRVRTEAEWSAEWLGADSAYQIWRVEASYHRPLMEGTRFHAGLKHAVVTTVGGSEDTIPFNKRLFPGGANSIRGYPEAEASPLDANGETLGAEVSTLIMLELEQELTQGLAVVLFTDHLYVGEQLSAYPGDDYLVSVGLGLRLRTVLGPVRLEYGHNVQKRAGDPSGTLHFTIGFPF